MGARGTKERPAEVLKLRGTYRKDRHGKRAMVDANGMPKKPRDLGKYGSSQWDTVVATRKAWLSRSDTESLLSLCENWELRCRCIEVLKEDPTDRKVRTAYRAYHDAWLQLAARFGLSPTDRARLGEAVGQAEEDRTEKYLA